MLGQLEAAMLGAAVRQYLAWRRLQPCTAHQSGLAAPAVRELSMGGGGGGGEKFNQ